jgi:hypothetical protein
MRVGHGKRPPNVLPALAPRQFYLRPRRARTHEQPFQYRDIEVPCEPLGQHCRLVKLPFHQPFAVQRDRNDSVEGGVGKVAVEVREGQLEERLGDMEFALIFEEMDGLT